VPARRRLILTLTPETGTAFRLRMTRVARGAWRRSFSFPYVDRWHLQVTAGSRVLASASLAARAPAASTFEPSGEPGCNPPSPANRTTHEARGVATSGDLWALLFDSFVS